MLEGRAARECKGYNVPETIHMKHEQKFSPAFVDPDSDHHSNPLAIGMIIMAACVMCGFWVWAIVKIAVYIPLNP